MGLSLDPLVSVHRLIIRRMRRFAHCAPWYWILLLTSCQIAPERRDQMPPVSLTKEQEDIYEALFRHQFVHNASSVQRSPGAYFLSIQGTDPSGKFLARFAGHHPPVKRASEARYGRHSGVYDPATRRGSLILSVEVIRWRSEQSVEVSGGYDEANLSASRNTYRLTRTKHGWRVTKDTLHFISDGGVPWRTPAPLRGAHFCWYRSGGVTAG